MPDEKKVCNKINKDKVNNKFSPYSSKPRDVKPIDKLGDWAKPSVVLDKLGPDTDDDVDEGTAKDFDWLPPMPGRPAPFSTTWAMTYSPLKVVKSKGKNKAKFTIKCEEKECGKLIEMFGAHQEIPGGKSLTHIEINQKSKKSGVQTKPPVCHDVSWAALKLALFQFEQLDMASRKLSKNFKRSVCWHQANLHPGHNGCNAAGTKTTEANVETDELKRAHSQIETVTTEFTAKTESIWDL